MRKVLPIFLLFLILVVAFLVQKSSQRGKITSTQEEEQTQAKKEAGQVVVFLKNLQIPWEIAFNPEGNLIFTERDGQIKILEKGKEKEKLVAKIPDVSHIGEGGLLGLALHPNFEKNQMIYIYYTYSDRGSILNRVVRYQLQDGNLVNQTVIIDKIPGGANHNGGRIKFGPDSFLYIATGDSGNSSLSQNVSSLAGKILRVSDDGSVPFDNPFNNAIYSLGHRNPQGLAWDDRGRLWSTEHGRSGFQSGFDELNLIKKGANYGWPKFQGDENESGFEKPILHSGPDTTWAPSGAIFFDGSIFFTGLRGQTLYEAKIQNGSVELKEHFKKQFGRLRTVVLGPDGFLYLATSNRDGRGSPTPEDDRIIRLNPQ